MHPGRKCEHYAILQLWPSITASSRADAEKHEDNEETTRTIPTYMYTRHRRAQW